MAEISRAQYRRLYGPTAGDRVRLYGQPRTYVCPPDAQCLIGGSIPIFDIGRAERMR